MGLSGFSVGQPDLPRTEDDEKSTKVPDTMAIRNLSLSIRPGEKVAICGRTGRLVSTHSLPIWHDMLEKLSADHCSFHNFVMRVVGNLRSS